MARPKKLPDVPPLVKLRTKAAQSRGGNNPCYAVMVSMLNCWASNGEGSSACKELELTLKNCTNTGAKANTKKIGAFNKNANRLLPQIHKHVRQ